ncbi:hypothetical protein GH714_005506 [Hevea brasiliensis]|uniref:Peptidase S8/S53 domain-containing protein n=1 Tax=Hevea brasiliensis TaxID=3981 RepID=A0A6A6LBS8_HEVBR|nr:hypothetical protein GH714_005506 [Hevea brasiliensis]
MGGVSMDLRLSYVMKEVGKLSEMDGVISAIPNHILMIHTTRSWDFMGLSKGKLSAPQEGNAIIGLPDTEFISVLNLLVADVLRLRVYTAVATASARILLVLKVSSQGLNLHYSGLVGSLELLLQNVPGMGLPPSKWKEYAKAKATSPTTSDSFFNLTSYLNCNASLQRLGGTRNPYCFNRNRAGVQGASYFGLAEGVARGGVPYARIGYKVCWSFGCAIVDILAAIDDAIADGVDILSVSLGAPWAFPYMEDPIAIGSFHAMRYDILTSNLAGNSGPYPYSISNIAP